MAVSAWLPVFTSGEYMSEIAKDHWGWAVQDVSWMLEGLAESMNKTKLYI
jgi:hypothetical protein